MSFCGRRNRVDAHRFVYPRARPVALHSVYAEKALGRWVDEYPERLGSIGIDGRGATWREVATSTRILRHRLERAGASAGDRVAVMAGRSRYALSSLLAIWAHGSSAVLLDERHPLERLRWVAQDAGCSVVVSSEPEAAALELEVVETAGSEIDSGGLLLTGSRGAGWVRREPGAEAYVVYTSGTTGRPKGVRVGVAGVENFLATAESLGYRPGSRAVSVVSPGFDGWLWSLLTPFANGATCVAIDTGLGKVEQALAEQRIDNLCMTPSLYAVIRELPRVEVAVVAGERCPDSLAERLRENADRVINVYGPTETTIAATMSDTARGEDLRTIGRPLPGYSVDVVDADLNEVPAGVTGEILIGGVGVALGYVGATGPDADRFIEWKGARHFRTGDLGALRTDGQLSILGRVDNQVKIGGFRVELEEIESLACQVRDIEAAVAYVREDPRTLALGVRLASGVQLDDVLRTRLAAMFHARLPRQLCPTFLHSIAAVPLEPTGKVSRREVAALGMADRGRSARAGLVLDRVLAAWSDVFGRSVTADADFFAIGGHSLLAAQLAARVEKELEVTMSITDVLTAGTPAAMARQIDGTRPA
ncbi:non-ribosomal peptide synthetase [Nocardia sp. NPDC020380]|uniref:non-ribosomal peptide synthetase n=1 Tax=Nocardia sp. NPDC020380 TaxID=3364309 RepID=UPI00378BBCFA